MRQGLDSRFRCHLPLLLAAAAGFGATSARAVTLPAGAVTEVHLVKAQHQGLRVHWQAVVGEEGGAFVLRRRGALPGADRVQPASPRQRAYHAAWHAPADSGVYDLRYRGTNGAETVLATLLVNCHTLDGGSTTAGGAPPDPAPLAVPALPSILPAPMARDARECAARIESLVRAPLVPPPRASRADA